MDMVDKQRKEKKTSRDKYNMYNIKI